MRETEKSRYSLSMEVLLDLEKNTTSESATTTVFEIKKQQNLIEVIRMKRENVTSFFHSRCGVKFYMGICIQSDYGITFLPVLQDTSKF